MSSHPILLLMTLLVILSIDSILVSCLTTGDPGPIGDFQRELKQLSDSRSGDKSITGDIVFYLFVPLIAMTTCLPLLNGIIVKTALAFASFIDRF